jgi:hypothetical protein
MTEANPQNHARITTTNSRTNPQINATQNLLIIKPINLFFQSTTTINYI